MRTSINLPDALLKEAKAKAAAEGKTLTSLIEEGLRAVLAFDNDEHQSFEPLPKFGAPDGRFLIDISDRDALWEALDTEGSR